MVRKKIQKVTIVKSAAQKKRARQRIQRPLLTNRTVVKFRYTDNLLINPAASGFVGAETFSANGLYDPFISGIGHQPRGFDQLMALYDHYTVIKSTCQVWYTCNPGVAVQCILALKDTSTVYTAPNDYTEMRNVKQDVATHDSPRIKLNLGYTTRGFLGVQHPLSEKDVQGNISSNPADQAYFHVGISDLNAGDLSNTPVMVQIDYVAVLTEPKNPGAS